MRDRIFMAITLLMSVPCIWWLIQDLIIYPFRERRRKKQLEREIEQYLASFDYIAPPGVLSCRINALGGLSDTYVKRMSCSHDEIVQELREVATRRGKQWFMEQSSLATKQIAHLNEHTDDARKTNRPSIIVMQSNPELHFDDRFGHKDREARLRALIGSVFGFVFHHLHEQDLEPTIEYVEHQSYNCVISRFMIVIPLRAAV